MGRAGVKRAPPPLPPPPHPLARSHGSLASRTGYACLMPALIAAFRAAWSATPGTTAPLAPFGLVSLSAGDSEGAADIASFRWAQQGSYGVVPNAAMPHTFMAHVGGRWGGGGRSACAFPLQRAPAAPPACPDTLAGLRSRRPVGELRGRAADGAVPRLRCG